MSDLSSFVVLPNDDGIRPAGKPDRCFYCHQHVGAMHLTECVMIVVHAKYDILLDGEKIGEYATNVRTR